MTSDRILHLSNKLTVQSEEIDTMARRAQRIANVLWDVTLARDVKVLYLPVQFGAGNFLTAWESSNFFGKPVQRNIFEWDIGVAVR